MPHPSYRPAQIALFAIALALSDAADAASRAKMLPQQFEGAQGKYEMCLKRHVLDLRKARGKTMEPLDEIASAQVACKKAAPKRGGEDVISSMMECGVAYGDGIPEQGCPQ
ncbi:hypothetical protein ACP4J4_08900 [Aureimonas ureilytica]|uniref:hypothetical protein n=1 Tax=Aureimonas ureilytica TaxID=401562 RepID=UPI003CED75DC